MLLFSIIYVNFTSNITQTQFTKLTLRVHRINYEPFFKNYFSHLFLNQYIIQFIHSISILNFIIIIGTVSNFILSKKR